MKKRIFIFFLFCVSVFGYGQNVKDVQELEIINHKVQSDESVRMLSKKYSADPADIYRLNRFAVDGISEGMVLQIPVQKKKVFLKQETQSNASLQEETSVIDSAEEDKKIAIELEINNELDNNKSIDKSIVIKHIVRPKETIYGLSKKYNVTVEEIQSNNFEVLKNGLQIGQELTIPNGKEEGKKEISAVILDSNNAIEVKDKAQEYIKHKVEPKETLYGLSKKYNVTVDEIKKQNETILINGLQVGQILSIKKG